LLSTKQTQILVYLRNFLLRKNALAYGRTEKVSFLIFAERDVSSSQADLLDETNRSIISTTSLHLLPSFHVSPAYQVFFLGSSRASRVGKLISGAASRLDAFSASPFWT
jgi:hypothetical protein